MSAEVVLYLLDGLSGIPQGSEPALDEGTVNFYPDGEGYLVNYPGKKSIFNRAGGQLPPSDFTGVPPAVSATGTYTRVYSFTDFLGVLHLVYVDGAGLYDVRGNSGVLLWTFQAPTEDGKHYPNFFVSNARLIICNPGDPTLQWDGVGFVRPLGVLESPLSPEVTPTWIPGFGDTIPHAHIDPFDDKTVWWFSKEPIPGPGARTSDDPAANPTYIDGMYRWIVQFSDEYGNKGKPSAATSIVTITARDETEYFDNGAQHELYLYTYPVVNWMPPQHDQHLYGTRVGRCMNLNADEFAFVGGEDIFYEEFVQGDVVRHRHTSIMTDEALAVQPLIDMTVMGPPSSRFGCHFGDRIWLLDIDGNGVHYSDIALTGQFRQLQQIRTVSFPVALVPAGDRLFIVGRRSVESWFESSAGPALIDADNDNGSSYGNSFVEVGSGVIFGLWNKGFGFYDGVKYKFVETPYYISRLYLDDRASVHRAVRAGDWYYLVIRHEFDSADNNVIIKYHISTGRWYIVEDTLNDITVYEKTVVGVFNDISTLFRGNVYPLSRIVTIGVSPPGEDNQQRSVQELKLLLEPKAFSTVTTVVTGESVRDKSSGTSQSYPTTSDMIRSSHPRKYWGRANATFADTDLWWVAPGDYWLVPDQNNNIVGFRHVVDFTFPAGKPVRLKGFSLNYGEKSVATQQG